MSKRKARQSADGVAKRSASIRHPSATGQKAALFQDWGNKRVTFVPSTRTPEELLASDQSFWRAKKIWDLPEGFTLLPEGRAGTIYFREGRKAVELAVELSGAASLDIVVFDGGLRRWIDLNRLDCEPTTSEEKRAIREKLVKWLSAKGLSFSVGGVVYVGR